MRSNRFRSWICVTSLALAYAGCASDDPMGPKTRPGSGGSGGSATGTSSGSNGTGGATGGTTGSNSSTSTSTGNTTASGPTGSGGGSVTSGGGSGGAGTTGGAGGAGSGTGGAKDAGGAGAKADAGTIRDATVDPDVPPPLCMYPDWMKGTNYKAGDIVMYMGKPYVALGDNPGLDPTISTFYWAPYTGCRPPPPPPPVMCPVLDKLLPNGEMTFKEMFTPTFQGWVPLPAYSYGSLCKALETPSLAGFVRSGNVTQDKREVAAFFANVALETAYLTYTDESGHTSSEQGYHGRGSLQITGQAIYSEVGAGLGLNLVGMPQQASQAPVVWQTGIWYWMLHANPSVGGANICHNAIVQGNFGTTVRIIKGDCASATDRATQYRKNCMLLGVDPGNTNCP